MRMIGAGLFSVLFTVMKLDAMHEVQERILELALASVASLDHDGVQ